VSGSPAPLSGRPGVLIAPTAWWGSKEDGVIGVGVDKREFKGFEGRVSASAVVTDLDHDGVREAIIGTEKGNVIALRADGGYAKLVTLGGAIEAPAMLADVDGNGTYELLIASNDGKLTCFETGSTAKPDISRFRGESPHNRGDLAKVSLGWQSSADATDPQPGATSSVGSRAAEPPPAPRPGRAPRRFLGLGVGVARLPAVAWARSDLGTASGIQTAGLAFGRFEALEWVDNDIAR